MGLPDQSEQNRNRLNFERNKYHFFLATMLQPWKHKHRIPWNIPSIYLQTILYVSLSHMMQRCKWRNEVTFGGSFHDLQYFVSLTGTKVCCSLESPTNFGTQWAENMHLFGEITHLISRALRLYGNHCKQSSFTWNMFLFSNDFLNNPLQKIFFFCWSLVSLWGSNYFVPDNRMDQHRICKGFSEELWNNRPNTHVNYTLCSDHKLHFNPYGEISKCYLRGGGAPGSHIYCFCSSNFPSY